MKIYLLSLLITSLLLSVIGILTPKGERDGLSKHVRLVAALVWLCILIAPLPGMLSDFRDWWKDLDTSFSENESFENSLDQFDQVLDEQSMSYFCDMLTQTLEERFHITQGDLRCKVQWTEKDTQIAPERVTLLLSGQAIWKSPVEMEQFVEELLGCDCVSAIE